MKSWMKLVLCLSFGWMGFAAQAAYSPLAVSIVPPLQFPPSDFNISGVRVSVLAGVHRDVYGLDLGLIGNITRQRFVGAAVSGVFNYTQGQTTVTGVQLAGLANVNLEKTNVYGIQAALGGTYNKADSNVHGVQLGLVNLGEHTDIFGVQTGIYNRAQSVYGLQLGIVNVANNLHGLQIGLLNFNYTGLFYVAPILNFGF
jgi:hypothetical protein